MSQELFQLILDSIKSYLIHALDLAKSHEQELAAISAALTIVISIGKIIKQIIGRNSPSNIGAQEIETQKKLSGIEERRGNRSFSNRGNEVTSALRTIGWVCLLSGFLYNVHYDLHITKYVYTSLPDMHIVPKILFVLILLGWLGYCVSIQSFFSFYVLNIVAVIIIGLEDYLRATIYAIFLFYVIYVPLSSVLTVACFASMLRDHGLAQISFIILFLINIAFLWFKYPVDYTIMALVLTFCGILLISYPRSYSEVLVQTFRRP